MKITSKDILDTLGIKVGDEILFHGNTYQLMKDSRGDYYFGSIGGCIELFVYDLIDEVFEHKPRKKKLGEKMCANTNCLTCPLRVLENHCSRHDGTYNLYKMLHLILVDKYGYCKNSRLYQAFKAELDKEVE